MSHLNLKQICLLCWKHNSEREEHHPIRAWWHLHISLTGGVIFLLRTVNIVLKPTTEITTQILPISHMNKKSFSRHQRRYREKGWGWWISLMTKTPWPWLIPISHSSIISKPGSRETEISQEPELFLLCNFSRRCYVIRIRLCASDTTQTTARSELRVLYYFKFQGKMTVIWALVFPACGTWEARGKWEKHFINLLSVSSCVIYLEGSFLLPI